MRDFTDQIETFLSQLILEEKFSLEAGRDSWITNLVDLLNVPSVWFADGPTGLRKSPKSDSIGIGDSGPATCFPTASALASCWDRELPATIGIDPQARGVQMLLGLRLSQKPWARIC